MTTAQQIADYFRVRLGEPTDEMERRKIHHLCYYAWGFALAMRGEPLFEDEIIAAEHGPWIPTVSFDQPPKSPEALPDVPM